MLLFRKVFLRNSYCKNKDNNGKVCSKFKHKYDVKKCPENLIGLAISTSRKC